MMTNQDNPLIMKIMVHNNVTQRMKHAKKTIYKYWMDKYA
ncbi:hypothetical protein MTBBW1_1280004 [Desulfamplus magnetovallimortis]|uniref:Uncharacterized protein n=1 Tax=Desulfamplus magnetovallimortis TaxID=1246637 RepID=A0A1W1H6U7_9BACT|nr:hypothetical protein MTBBW1_1280004 [Desulfamplus magnetovallimortis]